MTIAFVKNAGTFSSKTLAATAPITVVAGGVAAGNLLVVRMGIDGNTSPPTDSRGNTYTVPTNQTAYAILTTALVSGDTITVPQFGSAARAVSAEEFSAVSSSAPSTATNFGTSTAPSTSNVTWSAGDLVIGSVCMVGPTGDTYNQDTTPASFWTALTRVGTSGGSATSNATNNAAYGLPTSGATDTYNPTITSRAWNDDVLVFHPAGAAAATSLVFDERRVRRNHLLRR